MTITNLTSTPLLALLLATPVHAFNPSVTPPAYEIVFAGAASSSNTLRNWIIDNICDAAQPIDVQRRWTGTSYGNDWGVACVPKTHQDIDGDGVIDAGETVAAKNVLFRKRDTGGSGYGVTPVTHPMNVPLGTAATNGVDSVIPGGIATGFQVSIMTVSTGAGFNCDTTANPPTVEATAKPTNYTEFKCGAGVENRVPDAGLSDVEPNTFFGINTPINLPAYAASTSFSVNIFGALVYNTPVTLDLRNALQAVQFPVIGTNSDCNPASNSYDLLAAESERCMPGLSSTTITSLFTGGIQRWADLGNLPTQPNVIQAASNGYLTIPTGCGLKVNICRRMNGGQAQLNALFMNWPCDLGGPLPRSAPGSCLIGPAVFENSGSSDVSKCLDDFNDGSNTSTKNPTLEKRWAIGVISTENNTGNEFNYRYIKIDGSAPTIENTAHACYTDYAEASFHYRTHTATLLNAPLLADKTDTLVVLKHIAVQANTPDNTATSNLNFVHSWGQGGWLVTPKSTGGFNPPFSLVNPVSSVTRAPFGQSIDICKKSTAIKPIPVDACC